MAAGTYIPSICRYNIVGYMRREGECYKISSSVKLLNAVGVASYSYSFDGKYVAPSPGLRHLLRYYLLVSSVVTSPALRLSDVS
jgi:hypothetical protein